MLLYPSTPVHLFTNFSYITNSDFPVLIGFDFDVVLNQPHSIVGGTTDMETGDAMSEPKQHTFKCDESVIDNRTRWCPSTNKSKK